MSVMCSQLVSAAPKWSKNQLLQVQQMRNKLKESTAMLTAHSALS